MTNGRSIAPVAIIGAGIAGLTAANRLREAGVPVAVYEAGSDIAGMARSYADGQGFSYDFGAHFITNRLAAAIGAGARCRVVPRYGESVLVRERVYGYPLGLMRVPRFVASALRARTGALHRKPYRSAADAFKAEYGAALATEIALPLLEAWSGVPAEELAPATLGKLKHSIPYLLFLRLAGRLKHKAVSIGYSHEMPENPSIWHVYPEGGVAMLCDQLAGRIQDTIHLESPVEQINVRAGRVTSVRVRGQTREISAVVSTAPISILAKLVKGTTALEPFRAFRYRAMVFVNLRFKRRGILPNTVLWTPENHFPFFRLTETPLSMPWLAPPGKTLITADIGCRIGDSTWSASDEALGELCVQALGAYDANLKADYLGCRVLRSPIAYPLLLSEYESHRQKLASGTGVGGLYSIGRNGEFAHILMEDIYWRTTRKMTELVHALRATEQTLHEHES